MKQLLLHCPHCTRIVCACPGSDAAPMPAAAQSELELHVRRRRVIDDRAHYLSALREFGLAVVDIAIGSAA